MQQLLVLSPEQIETGVWTVAKAAGLLWEEGTNVVFRDRGARRIDGATDRAGPTSSRVRDIAQAFADGESRAYLASDVDVRLVRSFAGSWTIETLGVWPTFSQHASLETWGTWLIATNGVDAVRVWKGGIGFAPLAGVPFSMAKIVKRKQPFLLAFNTDNIGSTGVEWSSDSDVEAWTPSAANKAGNYNLRDLESEVVAVADLGPRLAVYSRSSMTLGTLVGGANVWGWQRAITGIGAVSKRSVVTLDPFNYGITQDGIFKTDGNSFVFVDDPAMLRYIKDNADFSRAREIWGFADSKTKSVTFYFLDVFSRWRSVSYYPEKQIFTKGDLQIEAAVRKEVFDHPLVVSDTNRLGTWQDTEKFFGRDIQYSLKTKPLDFGARGVMKLVQLVRVDGQWGAGMLRIRVHLHPEDPGEVIYDKPLAVQNYFEREAAYFSLEFYGSKKFYLVGIEVFGELGGVAL